MVMRMNVLSADISGDGGVDSPARRRWPARLNLRYAVSGPRTVCHRQHVGPLMIQRPFYPERDGTCHTYVLHPPGGVAGGDSLELDVAVAPGGRCLLTAPGAVKVYRAPVEPSRQSTRVTVGAGGVCELMPMETILFDQARTRFETDVQLEGDAVFFGWDMVSFGRPAAGERFDQGRFVQHTRISRDGRPIWFERADITGGSEILRAPYGFAGFPIAGTALYAGPLPDTAIERLRERVAPVKEGHGAFTRLDDLLVCRFIGAKVSTGRAFFAAAWRELRAMGQGKPAIIPRIWAT